MRYSKVSSIVTCVPLRNIIVTQTEPTIIASRSTMVKTFLDLSLGYENILSPEVALERAALGGGGETGDEYKDSGTLYNPYVS
jgi:hypothetical protein